MLIGALSFLFTGVLGPFTGAKGLLLVTKLIGYFRHPESRCIVLFNSDGTRI
jgi:hypothetical protein